MNTVALDYSQTVGNKVDTVGDSLRLQRQQLGMSVADVASCLNLPRTTIEALEHDRFSTLNNATYCQGYLRAYARLLQMDEHCLVNRYREQSPSCDTVPLSGSGGRRWLQSAPLLLAIAGLLLLCLTSFFFREQMDTRALPQANTHIDQSENVLSLLQSAETVTDTAKSIPPAQPAPAASKDQLTLTFSGDCWVEIVDADGERKVSRMLHAGDKIQLRGQSPFKVLLGYAPVVTLQFNGEPVALSTSHPNHLARVVVGRS